MKRSSCRSLAGIAIAAICFPAWLVDAQVQPPIRPVGPVVATSPVFGTIEAVLRFQNGNVLVQDGQRRQVVLLDSALRLIRTVLDSIPGRADSYCSAAVPGDGTSGISPANPNSCYLESLGRDSAVQFDPDVKMFIIIRSDGSLGTFVPPPEFLAAQAQLPTGVRMVPLMPTPKPPLVFSTEDFGLCSKSTLQPAAAVVQWQCMAMHRGVVARITVPAGQTVWGIGRGVIYLAVPEAPGMKLVKARTD